MKLEQINRGLYAVCNYYSGFSCHCCSVELEIKVQISMIVVTCFCNLGTSEAPTNSEVDWSLFVGGGGGKEGV